MIYIPSCGRWDRVRTIENFTPELLSKTVLVAQRREHESYANNYPDRRVLCLPKDIKTIEPTRRFIWERVNRKGFNKFFILDDDLTFCKRMVGDYKHTRYATKEQISAMFKRLYMELDKYPFVGISERLGNNRQPEEWKEVTRCIRCVGYNLDLIPFSKLKFGRMEVMEDYDLTLQLFRLGLPNKVWYEYCQEQGHSNSKGGCSTFRTLELHNANALKLSKYHPEFVKVREKKTKGGWFNKEGVSTRRDVTIQWLKAYGSSQA